MKQEDKNEEIEITPEMIEAGIDAASDFEDEYLGGVESVKRIYQAMAQEYLQSRKEGREGPQLMAL